MVPLDRFELPSLRCKRRALPLDDRGIKFGAPEEIRTPIGLLRRELPFPIRPQAHINFKSSITPFNSKSSVLFGAA